MPDLMPSLIQASEIIRRENVCANQRVSVTAWKTDRKNEICAR